MSIFDMFSGGGNGGMGMGSWGRGDLSRNHFQPSAMGGGGLLGLISPLGNLGMTAVRTPFDMISGAANGQGFGGTVGGFVSPLGNLAGTMVQTPFQMLGNGVSLISGLFNMLSGASSMGMPNQNIQLGQVSPMYGNQQYGGSPFASNQWGGQSYSQPLNGNFFGRGPSMFG